MDALSIVPTLTYTCTYIVGCLACCVGLSIVQMGPSGSGKTSLLNVLAQRVPHKSVSGGVFVDGSPLSKSFKRRMGFVFQVCSYGEVYSGMCTISRRWYHEHAGLTRHLIVLCGKSRASHVSGYGIAVRTVRNPMRRFKKHPPIACRVQVLMSAALSEAVSRHDETV